MPTYSSTLSRVPAGTSTALPAATPTAPATSSNYNPAILALFQQLLSGGGAQSKNVSGGRPPATASVPGSVPFRGFSNAIQDPHPYGGLYFGNGGGYVAPGQAEIDKQQQQFMNASFWNPTAPGSANQFAARGTISQPTQPAAAAATTAKSPFIPLMSYRLGMG